jgi:MoaA/NifB/PqqE/SkfB family radical SAM enzyme
MCSWWKSEKEEWPFSADEFVKVLDGVKKYIPSKKLDFTLLGGEPLFWKELDKFIEKLDKTKFNPILNTNSSMLSEKKVRKLKKAGLKVFILSLDSIRPEVHDFYRGRKGSFKEVMSAIDIIDKVYKGEQVITILPIIMEKNYRDLHRMVKWIGNNDKLHNISMQAIMPNIKKTKNIPQDSDYRDIWPQDSNNLVKELKRIIFLKKLGYSEVINNPDSQLKAFIDYYKNPYASFNENTITFCTYFSIKANGDLIISGQTVGSLKDNTFNELWESRKGIQARQNVYEKNVRCVENLLVIFSIRP